jgi:hypothetical protein
MLKKPQSPREIRELKEKKKPALGNTEFTVLEFKVPRHAKKQGTIRHDEEKNQSQGIDPEMSQMRDLCTQTGKPTTVYMP